MLQQRIPGSQVASAVELDPSLKLSIRAWPRESAQKLMVAFWLGEENCPDEEGVTGQRQHTSLRGKWKLLLCWFAHPAGVLPNVLQSFLGR